MPRALEPFPVEQVPAPPPPLPTGSLQDAWQDIVRRLESARDWHALALHSEHAHAHAHAHGWILALIQAQVIDVFTYRALGQAREKLHERVGQRLKEGRA